MVPPNLCTDILSFITEIECLCSVFSNLSVKFRVAAVPVLSARKVLCSYAQVQNVIHSYITVPTIYSLFLLSCHLTKSKSNYVIPLNNFIAHIRLTLFIHSFSMVLQPFIGPWPLLQFRNNFYIDCRTPWTSD
jgi:hypothetical protein